MKKNKLFVSLALTTLFLSAAAPVANAFADAETVDTEIVEEGTEAVSDDLVVPETPAVEEPSNEAEEPVVEEPIADEDSVDEEPVIDDSEVVEQPGEVDPPAEDTEESEPDNEEIPEYMKLARQSYARLNDLADRAATLNDLGIETPRFGELRIAYDILSADYLASQATAVAYEELTAALDEIEAYLNSVENGQEQPEAQYTTVVIELRGKDKGELLDTLTFTNKEVGSELVVEFPHFEGLVTPPNLTITVEEDHQLIVYYQTAPVVTDPDPDGNSDNDGEDDSDNGNDDNGEGTDDNVDPDGGNTGGDTDETVDPDNNDTSGGNVNTGNGNDTDASDNTNDTDNESNDNSSSSDNEVKETSKPKEEAKKSDDSSDKLYTDAEGLAKTSLSSEKSGPAAIGFVGAVIATIGALALFFFREKKTKA